MTKIKTSLLKIVGRINKVILVRDLILVAFISLLAYVAPSYAELLKPSKLLELYNSIQANPVLITLLLPLLLPFAILITMLGYIQKIDIWEDAKAIKRHEELLQAIKESKGNYGSKSEHLDSVL